MQSCLSDLSENHSTHSCSEYLLPYIFSGFPNEFPMEHLAESITTLTRMANNPKLELAKDEIRSIKKNIIRAWIEAAIKDDINNA